MRNEKVCINADIISYIFARNFCQASFIWRTA